MSDTEESNIDSDDSDAGICLNESEICGKDQPICPYQMLDSNQLIMLMNAIISEVSGVIDLSYTLLRLLLAHFSWDKDALTEFYFEYGADKVFSETRIYPHLVQENSLIPSDRGECVICCETKPLFGLACGHRFCSQCWENYLRNKIQNENQIDRILCPALGCHFFVDDRVVMDFVSSDDKLKCRYQKLCTNSFVCSNRELVWCPGKDCTMAARVSEPGTHLITCLSCKEQFCSTCASPWHDPVPCRQFKIWQNRVTQDSGTSNWIISHTKECPKCKAPIEKAGGCNHMICYNTHCKHEFCWVCLDRWDPHGTDWYSCNKYDQSKKDCKQSETRAELHRYLFYLQRYMNHAQSLRFEAKLYAMMHERMFELQNEGRSYIDLKFLYDIVDKLCRCRRTLMYTYVFAYYVTSTNESELFEQNQCDLELATENLSGLLERDLNTTPIDQLRQTLLDKAGYCDKRRQVLLNHVHEGTENLRWDYREN